MSTDIQEAYQAALDYLYSYIDYSLTHQQSLSPENFDLSRMFRLMEALGNPHQDYPVIHVAGSKGKGSVSILCASALQAQGYKVGLYTSPHLKDFVERFQINGEAISRLEFVTLVEEIKAVVESIPRLTTFEISTGLAFWYFSRQRVDAAVIEVGLGGRLDATNVVRPMVSVITALYLEHTYVLGNTLAEIAAEKAGIIKPGVPVVLAPQQDAALEVVSRLARKCFSPLILIGRDWRFSRGDISLDGQTFTVFKDGTGQQTGLRISLLGPHQVENAVVAYGALQVACKAGLKINETAIHQGFAKAQWPARFEVVQRQPPVIIDSAHTPGAIVKLQATLDEFYPDSFVRLVIGVSEDKDVAGMLEALKPRLSKIYCTQSPHPRALDADELAQMADVFKNPVQVIDDVGDALQTAVHEAAAGDLVLLTGSIFTAGSGRTAWFERIVTE
jgi:dihydrofolate synthase/folylpolyglutamate synthase